MLLTKEQILKAKDLPTEVVEVPEWGGSVIVRTLMSDVFDTWQLAEGKERETGTSRIRSSFCAICMVDKDGKVLFTKGDVAALGKKSGVALNRVWEVAQRLNAGDAGAVEDAVKNSSDSQSEDSSTG